MIKIVITYIDAEGEEIEIEKEFVSSKTMTALEQAEDYAYTIADKGVFDIEVVEDG